MRRLYLQVWQPGAGARSVGPVRPVRERQMVWTAVPWTGRVSAPAGGRSWEFLCFQREERRLNGQGIVCSECTCCFEIFSSLKTAVVGELDAVVGELDAVGRAGSNWVALRGFVSSCCRPLSWGLGNLRIRSAQNAGRRGGVAVCCFVKVAHPPFHGSVPFAAPSAIGS